MPHRACIIFMVFDILKLIGKNRLQPTDIGMQHGHSNLHCGSDMYPVLESQAPNLFPLDIDDLGMVKKNQQLIDIYMWGRLLYHSNSFHGLLQNRGLFTPNASIYSLKRCSTQNRKLS